MYCETCINKTCLATKKPCQEVENFLERENAQKGYSNRHMRRKEIPFDPFILNELADKKAAPIHRKRPFCEED